MATSDPDDTPEKKRTGLTEAKLRTVRATGVRRDLPDRHGLALRVGAGGRMAWTLTYRVAGSGDEGDGRVARLAGPRQRMTLGTYPALSLAEARAQALKALQAAQQGIDPQAQRRALAAPRARPMTVADLIERYAEGHLRQPTMRSGPKVEQMLQRHVLPAWGNRAVVDLARGDLVRLLEEVRTPHAVEVTTAGRGSFTSRRGGTGAAAEVRKWVRAMFQYALETELRADNPFAGVRNRDRAKARDRVLSMAELRAVWCAASAMPYPVGPYYQLLMLTGSRRGEWAGARWDWLDEAWSQIEIPSTHYKTGRPHLVPLSTVARRIVTHLTAPKGGQYLLSTDGGATHIAGFNDYKRAVDAMAERYYRGPMQPCAPVRPRRCPRCRQSSRRRSIKTLLTAFKPCISSDYFGGERACLVLPFPTRNEILRVTWSSRCLASSLPRRVSPT